MNSRINAIINAIENSYTKSTPLFGFHKDFFTGKIEGYELIFYDDDPNYPAMIAKKNYKPHYGFPTYN